jgi:hypothetical protein
MRVHLPVVKKYAFGKHVASAVERLSAAAAARDPPTAVANAEDAQST